jgi:hypothetical protein
VTWASPTHDLPAPPPAPTDDIVQTSPVQAAAPALTVFCPAPTEILRDDKERPWIHVDALTRDGVSVSFDLNVSYRQRGQDVATISDCDGPARHIMGLAKIVYAEKILAHDYADLPRAGATLPRAVAFELSQRLRTLMSFAAPEITGIGVKNARAPGLNEPQTVALLMQGFTLPAYSPPRLVVASHDGQTVQMDVAIEYDVSAEAYDTFGPHRDAIRAAVTQTVHDALRTAAVEWNASCMEADRDYIAAKAYAAAAARLQETAPGLYLLGLRIDGMTPVTDAPPPIAGKPAHPVCYSDAPAP